MTENHRRVAEEKRGVQEKLAGAQAEATRLQKELEAKSAEREYWFTVAGERSTTIEVMEQDLHNLEEERDGARTARAAALKNLDEQRRERDAAQFKVKGLENEVEALRSKHHRVKLNNDDLRRTHARMEKEIEALRADREHWGEMAQERAAAMAQMDKELEETKEKLADEMEKVDGLKKEVDEAEMRSYETGAQRSTRYEGSENPVLLFKLPLRVDGGASAPPYPDASPLLPEVRQRDDQGGSDPRQPGEDQHEAEV